MPTRSWQSSLLKPHVSPPRVHIADTDYVSRPSRLLRQNRIELLRSGAEAFPRMLEAIEQAAHYVHLSSYILRSDKIGQRFQRALIERAKSGLDVRVLFDAVGSFDLDPRYVASLRDAGVQVVEYHPIAPWRPRWGLNRRNHQKLLIVDHAIAFTGGMNIGDEYAPEPEGGGWHDMHARVEGSLVTELESMFRRAWASSVGTPYEAVESFAPHQVGPAYRKLAYSVDNFGLRNRSHMHHDYLHAIRTAQSSISIMNAYFLPDRGLRRAFRKAVRRGVSVRVVVPSVSDVMVVQYASRHLYKRLLRSGIRIFEWPLTMMHAKVGVIDGVWSTIGSYNLDARSFLHNLEVGLVIIDRDFAADLQQVFDADVKRCREVMIAECEKRSWRQRWIESIAYRFRYWM